MYQNDKSAGEKQPSSEQVLDRLLRFTEAVNVADELDEDELSDLGIKACQEFKIDERSRDDWVKVAKKGMETAKQFGATTKNYPFKNASNVNYPLLLVAALQFNARAYPALIDPAGVVKASPIGEDPEGKKNDIVHRVSKHMSWQLSHQMTEWEDDTDTMFMQLPIVGAAFRKTFRDKKENRNKSVMVPGLDLVVNQSARDIKTVPRITHINTLYPYEIEEEQRAGRFYDCDIQQADSADNDPEAPHEILEQHRLIDLDGDGYQEPYIVTVHKASQKVLRIQANYVFNDIEELDGRIIRIPRREYFTKYTFIPDPDGGFYGLGYAHLIKKLGAAIDTTINQMLDAGHLQNAGGGFIGSGVRLKKGVFRMEPGKYHAVDASGQSLRDGIVNMEHPGPSAVLFSMLDLLINAAQDITSVKDILTGETGDKVQTATTTLALIEQGMKVFSAIHKRVYRAFTDEFKILFMLNAENPPEQDYERVLDVQPQLAKQDYDDGALDVIPNADPRLVTDAQRMARAQLVWELSKENPYINPVEALRQLLTAAGLGAQEISSLLVEQPQPGPMEQLQVVDAEATVRDKVADIQVKEADAAKKTSEAQKTLEDIDRDKLQSLLSVAELENETTANQRG